MLTQKQIDSIAYFVGKRIEMSTRKNLVDAVREALLEYIDCIPVTDSEYIDEQPSDNI